MCSPKNVRFTSSLIDDEADPVEPVQPHSVIKPCPRCCQRKSQVPCYIYAARHWQRRFSFSLVTYYPSMSYYFVIISPTDTPLFEYTFGSSKSGGTGQAHFRNGESSRYMNQFIVHASLDIVEEVQWLSPNMWLKIVDSYAPTNSYISCFMTGSGCRFMLLHQPSNPTGNTGTGTGLGTRISTSIAMNPSSPQTEEAIRQFMTEVYEVWVKATMNPFYQVGGRIESPMFRSRVAVAGKKWL